MASSAQPLGRTMALAGIPAALVLAMTAGTLAAVFLQAHGPGTIGPADWAAVRFTVLQAALSAFLSCALAVPVARALARRRFRGRRLFIAVLGAPFIMPAIVATLGLVAVFGRTGWLNAGLGGLGLGEMSIYGPAGVVLAHVFFNMPLATRLLLQGWLAIPGERFRLAASLGMGPPEIAQFLERPMLRAVLPGAGVSIFLICLTSFTVALTLGGGPRATTIELAIYQAIRFDFDLGRAASLAALQFAVSGLAAVAALLFALPAASGAGLDRTIRRWDGGDWRLRLQDVAVLSLCGVFLLAPILAMALRGAPALAALPDSVWTAALRSVAVALASAGLTILLALALGLAIARARPGPARMLEVLGMLPLATSALVLGTGLFVILRPFAAPASLALPVTAGVNATLALPFALRALLPALRATEADYGRLADSLGMAGWARLRLLALPRVAGPLRFATALACALSMGDLGVIALFADPDTATLPLKLYQLMGAYRMDQAAGAALLLAGLSFGLFWIIDRKGRPDADA